MIALDVPGLLALLRRSSEAEAAPAAARLARGVFAHVALFFKTVLKPPEAPAPAPRGRDPPHRAVLPGRDLPAARPRGGTGEGAGRGCAGACVTWQARQVLV